MVGSSTKSKLRGIAFCAAALIAAPRVAAAADVDSQPTAKADSIEAVVKHLSQLEASDASQIRAQALLIAQQADELARTRALLDKQQRELEAARLTAADTEAIRAGSVVGAPAADDTAIEEIRAGASDSTAPVIAPVGQAPKLAAITLALPQGINVLTPKGTLVFDNALEYQNSASDRLVFAGIQIVSGVELGLLEASQTRNDSGLLLDTLRYGIANRLEVEATVPWVTRSDRVTLVETADTTLSRTETIHGSGLGDVEGTLRYQITQGQNGSPIVVAALRVISDSGTGPFNVLYDKQGVAQRLPTGSGFWALDPNFTVIYPIDPIVLFGAFGYQHSFGQDINKTFGSDLGQVRVGHVQPGDSISAAIGFAFSLNPRFSYSLGYRENYFFPTSTVFLPSTLSVTGSKQESLPLQAGALLVGGSYQINRHVSLNLNFEFGVTPDAPNDTILLRVPYAF